MKYLPSFKKVRQEFVWYLLSHEIGTNEFLTAHFISKIGTNEIATSDFKSKIGSHEFVCAYFLIKPLYDLMYNHETFVCVFAFSLTAALRSFRSLR